MAEERPCTTAPGSLGDAREIVDAWIEALPATQRARPAGLLESYRRLAAVVLRYGLDSDDGGGDDGFLDETELHKALDGVAAHARRSELTMSHLLGDLGSLTPATVNWLDQGVGDGAREPMRVVTRVVRALDSVSRHLVHLLEESDARARRERVEALAAMTDMLSHELRNQLGAARTASQMLLSSHTALGEDGVHRAAELVLASVEAGLRTVADVRALTASRTDRTDEGRPSQVPLPNLIGTIAERLQTEAGALGVALEVHSGVDCRVDASRLRLIVFNLVWNGIKYRDGSKERPFVRTMTRRRSDGRIEVRVIDNGVGITPDEIDRIFQYRVRGRHAGDVVGSGLGLAIVKEAVEQLGGEIHVTSEVGVGTTFTLLFESDEDDSP